MKKDVDCLIRTYTVRRLGRQALDDVLDCPFRELGLMEAASGDEGRAWRFVVGRKPSLPAALIAYSALEFAMTAADGARSVSIARLAHEPGSPGSVFRLSESGLFESLWKFSASDDRLLVAEPAGLRQLLFTDDPAVLAAEILANYYRDNEMIGLSDLSGVGAAAPRRAPRRAASTGARRK